MGTYVISDFTSAVISDSRSFTLVSRIKIKIAASPGIGIEHSFPGFCGILDYIADKGFQIFFTADCDYLYWKPSHYAASFRIFCQADAYHPFQLKDKSPALILVLSTDGEMEVANLSAYSPQAGRMWQPPVLQIRSPTKKRSTASTPIVRAISAE